MDEIQKSMYRMDENFNKQMAEFEAKLQETRKSTTISSLEVEFSNFKQLTTLSLTNLQRQLETVTRSLDGLEMRSRRKILLLHGVAEEKNEDTSLVAVTVFRDRLDMNYIIAHDIEQSQRLGRFTASVKPRPLLIKMRDVYIRDQIWSNKTKLKGTGITLSEFLTKNNYDVFVVAREKFGVSNCWTREGKVFILGPDNKHHRVSSMLELNKFVDCKKPAPSKTRRTTATEE